MIAFVKFSLLLFCFASSYIVFMGNCHHISQEIKEVALKMSQEGLPDEQIKQYLDISRQAMR